MVWPTIVSALWEDRFLQSAILSTGEVSAPISSAVHAARDGADPLADTGSLPSLGDLS